VHPDGRFVYGSNRGHDSIAIFAVGGDGRLDPVGHESTQGRTPRNFTLDLSGSLLLAANQKSDNIVTFRVDADSGTLQPTGHSAAVPSPVCLIPVPGT
jgi:6-phosphogluconolactonase